MVLGIPVDSNVGLLLVVSVCVFEVYCHYAIVSGLAAGDVLFIYLF